MNDTHGNKKFREMVELYRARYQGSERKGKIHVAKKLYEEILHYGGRFLRKQERLGYWYEVQSRVAIEKVRSSESS